MAKGGLSKEKNPMGRVLHDRGTVDRPSPPTGVGNEREPDMKGTQEGGSAAEGHVGHSHLGHAVHELESQHPHHHSMGGVHHTTDHIRHVPLHAMESEGRHHHSAHMHKGPSHSHPQHERRHMK